ncbi:MAG: DUF2303 family protein [Nevskiaceae bacterium]|nr:MAG: DUF2303 family protein [Nevskiaceae bacterium]
MSETDTTLPSESLPALLGKPASIDVAGVPGLALPPGWTHDLHPELLSQPQRTARAVVAHEVGGLVSYVNRFKNPRTALYCTSDKQPSLLARIDDHQPNEPSHVEHTATYPCPVTEEWGRWTGKDRVKHDQKTFAEFIEENIRDVVEPSGTAFLAAITNFSDTRKVEFRSATRLSDGSVNFQYADNEKMVEVAFPSKIVIAIPVFMGMPDRYQIDARVKYQLTGSDLKMWFELDRPDLRRKAAYEELIERVEKETGLPVHRAI